MTKRLLALSWTMPPLVFPRSLQISRSLRHLRIKGWDTSLVTTLPEAMPNANLDMRLGTFYADSYVCHLIDSREQENPSPLWLKTRRLFQPKTFDIAMDNWKRRAGQALSHEIETGGYDVMVTFAQPWIDHIVGLRMKRKYPALPWVAHFSDPWLDNPYIRFTSERDRRRTEQQEREVIAAADAVIFTNPYTVDLVMAKYPESWRRKVYAIPHTIAPDLLGLLPPKPPRGQKMRIVYTGNFYGHRQPDVILQAIGRLTDQPEIADRLQLEFIGNISEHYLQMAHEMGLSGMVSFTGIRNYLDSLEAALAADLLLLIDAPADVSVFLPSKIVDYFMLRRPILGITPKQGAAAAVLTQLGFPVIDPGDSEAIAQALALAVRNWATGQEAYPLPPDDALAPFGIEETTLQLDEILRQVTVG